MLVSFFLNYSSKILLFGIRSIAPQRIDYGRKSETKIHFMQQWTINVVLFFLKFEEIQALSYRILFNALRRMALVVFELCSFRLLKAD
jgi:hypothetical protein